MKRLRAWVVVAAVAAVLVVSIACKPGTVDATK
jgi:hypothetical protein